VSLILSCIVLIWSICRLARIVGSLSDMMVSKVMLVMHIATYLFIIFVNVLVNLTYFCGSFRTMKISTICGLIVYSVCNLIFGLIVN
jgi:hypothetical protein